MASQGPPNPMKSMKESLLVAVRKGQAEKVSRMLQQATAASSSSIHPDMEADSARNCLLHRAARYGHINVVKVLLDAGADPNRRNKFGMTPLHHAAVGGDAEVVSALLNPSGGANGVGADAGAVDDAGRAPLHWAAAHGFVGAARALLQANAPAGVADKEGFTPLHRCCQEKPPKEKQLKKEGEEEKEEDDPTPDPEAEDRDRAELARLLLDCGADISAVDVRGLQTPLHLCAMNGYAATARVILGSDQGKSSSAVDARNKISVIPLIYAVRGRHLACAKAILESRPNMSLGDELHFRWAALHWAVLEDDEVMVRALLDAGADPAVADVVGRTPMELARENGKEKAEKALKEFEDAGKKKGKSIRKK